MKLSHIQMFRGINEHEIEALLQCLESKNRTYKKGRNNYCRRNRHRKHWHCNYLVWLSYHTVIFGAIRVFWEMLPRGCVCRSICLYTGQPLLVTVSAAEDTTVLFMNVGKVLSSLYECVPFSHKACPEFINCVRAEKLAASQKILHTNSKSIRGRLMSYFSECAKRSGSQSFLISYNRQQLGRLSERRSQRYVQ